MAKPADFESGWENGLKILKALVRAGRGMNVVPRWLMRLVDDRCLCQRMMKHVAAWQPPRSEIVCRGMQLDPILLEEVLASFGTTTALNKMLTEFSYAGSQFSTRKDFWTLELMDEMYPADAFQFAKRAGYHVASIEDFPFAAGHLRMMEGVGTVAMLGNDDFLPYWSKGFPIDVQSMDKPLYACNRILVWRKAQ